MRRLVSWVLFLSAAVFGAAGCATYAQDLDWAKRHYESNQYEQALALFYVIEHDMDSYSQAEQAQYAYLRGMTDYRLAGLAPQGAGVADPRKGYRDNARHWLALAAAIEKSTHRRDHRRREAAPQRDAHRPEPRRVRRRRVVARGRRRAPGRGAARRAGAAGRELSAAAGSALALTAVPARRPACR